MQDRFPNPSTFRNTALYGGQTLLFTFMFMELYVEHLISVSVSQMNCHLISHSALLVPVCEMSTLCLLHSLPFWGVLCSTGSVWEDIIFFGFVLVQ